MRVFRLAIPASQIDRSRVFYEQVLGMETDNTVPSRLYFHCGDVIVAVIDWAVESLGPFQPIPDNLYFATTVLDAVHDPSHHRRRPTRVVDRDTTLGRTILLLPRSRRQPTLLRRRHHTVPRPRGRLVLDLQIAEPPRSRTPHCRRTGIPGARGSGIG